MFPLICRCCPRQAMYWCEAWCCQETGRHFPGSLPFSEDITLSSILRFVSRLPHVCIDSRSELVLYYLSRSWQHRVVICVLEASFGRQSCTPNTMSCLNELTRRWTFDEHVSSGYFHFPVKKVARNTNFIREIYFLFSELGRLRRPRHLDFFATYGFPKF